MLLIDNKPIDTLTNKEDKVLLGTHYEKIFLEYLHSRKYDYKKHADKYSPYDFYNNKSNIFLELKTRLNPIITHNVVYISCSKICRYRQIEKDYNVKCKFYLIYNFIDTNTEKNEYYYYDLDIKKILNNNVIELSNDPCFIITTNKLKPIKLLFPYTICEYYIYYYNTTITFIIELYKKIFGTFYITYTV